MKNRRIWISKKNSNKPVKLFFDDPIKLDNRLFSQYFNICAEELSLLDEDYYAYLSDEDDLTIFMVKDGNNLTYIKKDQETPIENLAKNMVSFDCVFDAKYIIPIPSLETKYSKENDSIGMCISEWYEYSLEELMTVLCRVGYWGRFENWYKSNDEKLFSEFKNWAIDDYPKAKDFHQYLKENLP